MAFSLFLGLALAAPLLVTGAPAGADQVSTLKQEAQYIAGEIQAAQVKLYILNESYLMALSRVSWDAKRVANATSAIARTVTSLDADRAHLRQVAIEDYVSGDASQSLSVVFDGSEQTAGMQQTYIQAASGNLDESETNVLIDQRSLTLQRATLQRVERIARVNAADISSDLSEERSVAAQLDQEQAQVKGQLAQAVAAAERAQAAAFAAALQAAAQKAAAEAARQQESVPPVTPVPTTPVSSTPSSTGSTQTSNSSNSSNYSGSANSNASDSSNNDGQVAVHWAQSQLGVPYVWGGATPGVGFDCSGLTMWAWGQAGVYMAHGATEQYYEIEHVSMSDLVPGDLIFYGDAGLLYHVVMYIGGGMVVQAEETGTNVMDTPIPPGAYGAGRP